MSFRSLGIGANALTSQSDALGVTANNLANQQTPGFRRSRANFESIAGEVLRTGGPGGTGLGIGFGGGSNIGSVQVDFSPGTLTQTGRPTDIAITGPGLLRVRGAEGDLFTRDGSLTLNGNGELVTSSGLVVEPGITVPSDATGLSIGPDGTVTALQEGETVTLGQIEAARFINPEGLLQEGGNLFSASGASGPPILGDFGELEFGTLEQGFLEGSNVEVVTEVVDLIENQQAFGLAAQVVQAANQRLEELRNLTR